MKRISILFFISVLFQSVSYSAQPEIISVDFDDVISSRVKVNFKEYASLIPRIVLSHPSILFHLWSWWNTLEKDGREIAQSVNGASNVIHALIQKLKDEGYADLSDYESELIARTSNPKANLAMITLLKALKKQGYTLIGATNQDYLQDITYRKKMKDQGVDLDALFDAIIVTRVNHLNTMNGIPIDDTKPYTEVEDGIYMLNDPKAVKPHPSYYEAEKLIAQTIQPDEKLIIHVDDKRENIEGADAVSGVKGIQFYLPSGSARKSSLAELARALEQYKQGLAQFGITDNPDAEIKHLEPQLAN